MSIKSAPFYYVACDRCGERDDYGGEHAAWADTDGALEMMSDDWHTIGDKHYCTFCVAWDDDADEVVPLPPEDTP